MLKQLVFLGKVCEFQILSFKFPVQFNRIWTVFQGRDTNLEERILEMNPIMEAFGNAKTGINANSSRFGKYLDIFVAENSKITGARISVYLLEQSRIVKQAM